jgi:hypothetical protein
MRLQSFSAYSSHFFSLFEVSVARGFIHSLFHTYHFFTLPVAVSFSDSSLPKWSNLVIWRQMPDFVSIGTNRKNLRLRRINSSPRAFPGGACHDDTLRHAGRL